jgi:F-type H+-transporting ATPase subunit epsilon
MSKLHLKIVTPEQEVLSEEVDGVNVPTTEGVLGILPNHANLMAQLKPGVVQIKRGGKAEELALGFGFLQVADNTLTIMADLASRASDIDEKAVEEAKKRAEKALEQKLSDEEVATTLAFIEKASVQLKIKHRHRSI